MNRQMLVLSLFCVVTGGCATTKKVTDTASDVILFPTKMVLAGVDGVTGKNVSGMWPSHEKSDWQRQDDLYAAELGLNNSKPYPRSADDRELRIQQEYQGSPSLLMESRPLAAPPESRGTSTQAEELWPDLSSPPKAIGGGEKDAAVIVGAENYLMVAKVPGARRNAGDWHAYLTDTLRVPFDRVALLRDNEATDAKMRRFATQAAGQVQEGGTLWFVFIGHGAPSKDGKDGLLVGVDAQQDPDGLYERSLPRNDLLRLLSRGKQAKTVVLIDACFSGRSPSGEALIAGLQPLVLMNNRPIGVDQRTVLLTAAKFDQFAGPLPRATMMRPAFSYLALGALRGWAADDQGRVTASALVDFSRRALALEKGRMQTPELTAGGAGVVLGTGTERAPNLAKIDREGGTLSATSVIEQARIQVNVPEHLVQTQAGKAGIEWVTIPGGTFMMGSENGEPDEMPVHRVRIKSFQMAKTLVTNRQYKECLKTGICTPPGRCGEKFVGDDDRPVVCVTWEQAKKYSKWVGGRLPSEAEWEYAARSAGKDWRYPWGNTDATCDMAVTRGCATTRMSVCSRPAGNTEQGLCDMAGNAWEWVQDMTHISYLGAPTDGRAWEDSGMMRAYRGGSWDSSATSARTTSRVQYVPFPNNGFRPAKNIPRR